MSRSLVCEICGEKFTCEGPLSAGCWCQLIEITTEKSLDLQTKSSDCVCPRCLAN